MMEIQKKAYNSKYSAIQCDLGHEVERVYTRKGRKASHKAIPFYYCKTCNIFLEPKLVIVKKVGKIV